MILILEVGTYAIIFDTVPTCNNPNLDVPVLPLYTPGKAFYAGQVFA